MAYLITSFDGLALPNYAPVQYVGSDGSKINMLPLASGDAFDVDGTARAKSARKPIRIKFLLIAESIAEFDTAFDAIKAKNGVRGTLTATFSGQGTRTRTARCEVVDADSQPGRKMSQEIEMIFHPTSPGWKGPAHADATTLNVSPKTVVVTNGGNRSVTDAILTITVPGGEAAITLIDISLELGTDDCDIYYSGTIAAGTSLVIDCGARTCKNNGTDDIANFTRSAANHKNPNWLELRAGTNNIIVTITGGGTTSTFTPSFNDGWE